MSKKDRQSAFSLEGRFLGFVVKDGYKLKRLRLMAATGECSIKLPKEVRASVGGVLLPGDWIQVWGEQTISHKTSAVKLKAHKIASASQKQAEALQPMTKATAIQSERLQASPKAVATVLVCQKSSCMKRGGKAICQALQSTLSDRDLTDAVKIRGTGCMKHCKAGPNIVIMPDKTRYSSVSASDIPALVEEHFS